MLSSLYVFAAVLRLFWAIPRLARGACSAAERVYARSHGRGWERGQPCPRELAFVQTHPPRPVGVSAFPTSAFRIFQHSPSFTTPFKSCNRDRHEVGMIF